MPEDPQDGSTGGSAGRRGVPQPHDAVFRLVFGEPEHAASQLRCRRLGWPRGWIWTGSCRSTAVSSTPI